MGKYMTSKERFEKIVNTKIGKWTILDKPLIVDKKNYYVSCICECGVEKLVALYSIIGGQSFSCKKCRVHSTKGFEEWKRKNGAPNIRAKGVAALNRLFSCYRCRARDKGLEFNLTKEQFKEITSSICYYCGKLPETISGGAQFNGDYIYNGIDRKNNSVGYVMENCLTCCEDCNFLKKDRDYDKFIALIHKISENIKNEKKS